MAESLNAEQIAERRTNLRAFRTLLEMEDDDQLTTTLLMQEEWLATVDGLQGYARDALTLRGLRTRKCLLSVALGGGTCVDHWVDTSLHCAPCYLRAIHKPKDLPATSIAPVPESFVTLPLHAEVPKGRPTDITEIDLHYLSMDTDEEPVPDFDALLPGRECCWEHDCPHHDGMKTTADGRWYNPFYSCTASRPCREDCPHTVGMRRDGNGGWYDPNDPTDGRYRPDR